MDFTPASLFISIVVSAVGLALFTYGRKTTDIPKLVVGLAMLVYPYFVSSTAVLVGVAVALIGGLWVFDSYL
jgi:hypothetical protein